MTISAVIIAGKVFNKDIFVKTLRSVDWVDEIVKVDASKIKGSFSEWRNEGLKKASSEWLFYIDTDEEITPGLREEIERNILAGSPNAVCYAVPRRNFIFGKEFRHGGQWPDYQKRLFLKANLKGWSGDLHEEPIFDGHLDHLKNPLIHHKDINIHEMLEKTNRWSEIEGKLMYDAGHPQMNTLRFLSAGMREFFLRMIKQMSFLDGKEGIIYALYQVYSKLISYSKLWEMQQKYNTKR